MDERVVKLSETPIAESFEESDAIVLTRTTGSEESGFVHSLMRATYLTIMNALINAPKKVVKFDNGLKLESREDGVYLIYKTQTSENEEVTEEKLLFISEGLVYADESVYAATAEFDTEGNYLPDTRLLADENRDMINMYGENSYVNYEDSDNDVVDCELCNNNVSYYGVVSSINVTTGSEASQIGFSAALYFATPETIPENYSQFPDDICFKGDSTDEGFFVPEANMRYTVVFDFDGYMVNAYVSGVSLV